MIERLQLQRIAATKAGRVREQTQHVPKPAHIRFSVRTTGVGETRLVGRQGINFGAYLLDEPTFTWGVVAAGRLAPGELPFATAMVLKWIKNSGGFWVGADLGFVVQSEKDKIQLVFTLIFEASTLRSTAGTGSEASRGRQNPTVT